MPRTGAGAPSRRAAAKAFNETRARAYEAACSDSMQSSLENLHAPLSVASRNAVAASLSASASDPYGDGDQSPVPPLSVRNRNAITRQADPLRSAWSTGLDLHLCLLGDVETWFHRDCYEGEVEDVRDSIKAARKNVADGDEKALPRLLEGRLSMLRLTPLHVCCHGARMHGAGTVDPYMKYYQIAQLLLENGARPDARDLCGYTPMSTAAGFQTTVESLALVPLLKSFGADPNAKTRFGEGLLVPPIMAANVVAFRALIQAGADVNLADRTGLTPRTMGMSSQALMKEIVDGQRQSVLNAMRCDHCGKEGARKHCAACKKAYYCSKECQKNDWKNGHKKKCGKEEEDSVDVVVGVMTTREEAPGVQAPIFTNNITGVSSNHTMKMKDDKPFVVKVTKPMTDGGSVKINQKNSDWLLVKGEHEVNERLARVVRERGIEAAKVYLSAKWVRQTEVRGEARDVLRVDVSRPLPPPKPLW